MRVLFLIKFFLVLQVQSLKSQLTNLSNEFKNTQMQINNIKKVK